MSEELKMEFDESLNPGIKLNELKPYSNKVLRWRCLKNPNHIWYACLSDRIRKNTGCPYCNGKLVDEGVNDIVSKYPNISKEFMIERNGITPNKVSFGSGKRYWWKCSICGTEWVTTPNKRTARHKDVPGCKSCKLKLYHTNKNHKNRHV